jgi:hypothetical protein
MMQLSKYQVQLLAKELAMMGESYNTLAAAVPNEALLNFGNDSITAMLFTMLVGSSSNGD